MTRREPLKAFLGEGSERERERGGSRESVREREGGKEGERGERKVWGVWG